MSTDGDLNAGDIENSKWLADALRSIQAPSTALLWYGMFSVLLAVVGLVILLVSPDTFFKPAYDKMLKAQKDQPGGQALPPYKKFVHDNQLIYSVTSIVALGGSFVIVIGGMKMKQMGGYGWAVAGSILAAIPCSNSCCCIGLPVGIWSLVVLFGADVKLGFARIAAAGGLERFTNELPPSAPE